MRRSSTLAHAGLGAVSHLCGMLFQKTIGAELTTVPYQGTAPALNALLGGQVDILCDQTTQTLPHIKAGSVKLYGVTTRERIKLAARYAELDEQGLKDFEVKVWHGIYMPKGTPAAVVDKLQRRAARRVEGSGCRGADDRARRRHRARAKQTHRRTEELAAAGDRQVGRTDPRGRPVRRLTL